MINNLNLLFNTENDCKEKTLPCKIDKNRVDKIYKPDSGIKNLDIKKKLFPNHKNNEQPMLCDCAIIYDKTKLVLVEIKCGTVTNSLLKDVVIKLENTSKLVNHQSMNISKYILLYKKFDNTQIKKKLATLKICGQPLISKKFEKQAIAI